MTEYLLYRNKHILPENRPSYRQQTLTQLEREPPKLQTPRNWKRSYNQETGSDIYFNMDTYDVVDTIDEVYDYEAQQALRRRARTTHQGRTSNRWNDNNIRLQVCQLSLGFPKMMTIMKILALTTRRVM